MKIKGYLHLSYEVYIIIASFRSSLLSAPIEFILDTGSSKTIINDKDALRLNVDYAHLESSETKYYGLGGTEVESFILPNCRISFTDEIGRSCPEDLEYVIVLRHKLGTKRDKETIGNYPSLLGLDILRKYKITFANFNVTLEL